MNIGVWYLDCEILMRYHLYGSISYRGFLLITDFGVINEAQTKWVISILF